MSGRTIWIIFSILQCGVFAEVRSRYFTLQEPPAFMQLYVQITHKKTPVIPVAVSCATDPNCVFFSTGEMIVWGTVDQTGPTTGKHKNREVQSVNPDRNQKIDGHWKENPWRICELWKTKDVTCDPATNTMPRTECVCQPKTWRYENIYNMTLQLSQTMGNLTRITIKGTFSSKLIIKLTNSKLRRKKPFFIYLHQTILEERRSNKFYKINFCPNQKPLIQGKPLIFSLFMAKNTKRIILNNVCYINYPLTDRVYQAGVDQIMVLNPKDAVLSTETCDAKKFLLLHGCMYQNIERVTRMTIGLPLTPRGHLSVAAKVDFAHYEKKLIWLLKSTTRRQQDIKIVLVPEVLTLRYKQSSLIERQKLRLGNKFLFTISAYRDQLQYSLNDGLEQRCKMKYWGLFKNVDKIQIRNPIVLKEMYIQ